MQGQNRFSFIIILVLVLSILHSSKALKCKSTKPDGSLENMECPPGMPSCVKLSNPVFLDLRACATDNFCKAQEKDWKLKSCHECKQDLCNASTKNMVSAITMLTSGVIAVFWTIQ